MFAQQSLFLKNTIIERDRVMPVPARLLVRKGQMVRAVDPIAEDLVYPEHVLIDAARGLGVSEDRVGRLLQCKPGMRVQSGDLLAGPVGFPRRVIRAPKNGTILYAGRGQILIGLEGTCQQLLAGYPGEVIELIPDRGVRIRAYGSLVQGIWGNGFVGEGEVEALFSTKEEGISPRELKSSHLGKIIISNYTNDPILFDRAVDIGIKGLVFGCLDPMVIKKAKTAPIPIVIIEGFGEKPMNQQVVQIFQSSHGKMATLNAEPLDLMHRTRPEVVIPTPGHDNMTNPDGFQLLEPGKLVRVISLINQNYYGILEDFIGRVKFPNGFYAEAVKVKVGDETMIVPLLNIELISDEEVSSND